MGTAVRVIIRSSEISNDTTGSVSVITQEPTERRGFIASAATYPQGYLGNCANCYTKRPAADAAGRAISALSGQPATLAARRDPGVYGS